MFIRFDLQGEMVSKKNTWRRGRNGGVYIPPEVKAALDGFLWQLKPIRAKLGSSLPIDVPCKVSITFYNHTRKKDVDNMGTSVLDLLQKAGILKNDRLAERLEFNRMDHGKDPSIFVTIDTEYI